MAIRRILIANRGEIAARIIRSCRSLGIETVLAVSAADRDGEPARAADRVVCIGPARSAESYLNAPAIVHAAVATGADAIHPGYGFLSERAVLPRLCESAGIVFIGPTADQLAATGDKLRARAEAQAADVPVVPGGAANSPEEAQILARIPMGRFAQPGEIAKAVLFLAADADYITGQQINVNGGVYM